MLAIMVPGGGERTSARPELTIGNRLEPWQQAQALAPAPSLAHQLARTQSKRRSVSVTLHHDLHDLCKPQSGLTLGCNHRLERKRIAKLGILCPQFLDPACFHFFRRLCGLCSNIHLTAPASNDWRKGLSRRHAAPPVRPIFRGLV